MVISSLDQKIEVSKVGTRKVPVKIPELKLRKKDFAQKKEDAIPVSLIINILIKSAIEKAKRERKEKKLEDKSYKIIKQERILMVNGGYGTVSKGYGSAPHNSYIDYEKLFSYLGKFKSKNPYENISDLGESGKAESGSFALVDRETMEKGKTYIRYFNSKIPIDKSSLVPMAGMDSAEWEQFKMWMRLDPVMYLLKISTS